MEDESHLGTKSCYCVLDALMMLAAAQGVAKMHSYMIQISLSTQKSSMKKMVEYMKNKYVSEGSDRRTRKEVGQKVHNGGG